VKYKENNVPGKKENTKLGQEERLEKKKAILTALAKASEDSVLLQEAVTITENDPQGYYVLSRDEISALVYGDMEKIESWVSNMDRNHATRLLRWLIKERW
jgi:hypothetical protein